MLVKKSVLVSVLMGSAATLFTSTASAGFDNNGDLSMRASSIQRALKACEKGKGFYIKDARTGSKTRITVEKYKGKNSESVQWLEPDRYAKAELKKDNTYRICAWFYPRDDKGAFVQLQDMTPYNVTVHWAPREIGLDGQLRVTVGDIQKAYERQKPLKVRNLKTGKREKVLIQKFYPYSRDWCHGIGNDNKVITGKKREDSVWQLKFEQKGLHTDKAHFSGTVFFDLKATVIQ